jgi:hypothetical protein
MFAFALAASLVLNNSPTLLVIDVSPPGVVVRVDGKKVGTSGDKPLTVKVAAGTRTVRLEHKGDSHEEEVPVKAGEKKTFVLKLEDGRKDPSEPSTPAEP